jgi:pyrimidine-nucleoside phosphorylase
MELTPTAIIARKRDGDALSGEQIATFVNSFSAGLVADYQMAALAMAIYLQGMTTEETAALTQAMLQSGTTLTWPADGPPIVDKHSTGGVGDKVSLVLAPLLACCGLWVPMISGRGLGPTGGTLDKLESIPGFRTDLTNDEIQANVAKVGCVITGASAHIAPADKKLYALRDVTATVASIPLITASIMSKKLAEGLTALVLDVKFGSGAFMKTREQARTLALSLTQTGAKMGVATSAQITDMNQPLGRMIGNSLEVNESLDALRGNGPSDLVELTISLGAELLVAVGSADSHDTASSTLEQHLRSGRASDKFCEMVIAQGGDLHAAREIAPVTEIQAPRRGYVSRIGSETLGQVLIELGGGRKVMTDTIDHAVGLEMLVKLGDAIEVGQPWVRIFAHKRSLAVCRPLVESSITIDEEQPPPSPLIVERVGTLEPPATS